MENFFNLIQELIRQWGAWGVFWAGLVEEIVAPIPSFAVSMVSGYLLIPDSARGFQLASMIFFIVALPLTLGISLGSLVIYGLGYFFGKPAVEKFGKFLGFSWRQLEVAEEKIVSGKADELVLLGLRIIPVIPNAAVNIFCGIVRYPLGRFLTITFFGSLIRNTLVSYLGWQAGSFYTRYAHKFEVLEEVGLAVLLLVVITWILFKKTSLKLFINKFGNTVIFLLILFLAIMLEIAGVFGYVSKFLAGFGYFGGVAAGFFMVSVFTTAPALFVLYELTVYLPLWQVSLAAGLGAMLGDYLILKIFKDRLWNEWRPWLRSFFGPRLTKIAQSRHFKWLLPVLGAVIIASPFPDEIGISLLGLSHIKRWQFLVLTFLLNSLGIFLILESAKLITA